MSADEEDLTPGNNDDEIFTPVDRISDLQIEKVDASKDAVAGETYTYTLTITNLGPSDIDVMDMVISDTIPLSTTFHGPSSPDICEDDDGDRTVICQYLAPAPLVSGDFTTIELYVDIDANVATGTVISNTAYVDGLDPDPDRANNVTIPPVETTVVRSSDLSIDKFDAGKDAVVGEVYSYTIVISNTGPSDTTGGCGYRYITNRYSV